MTRFLVNIILVKKRENMLTLTFESLFVKVKNKTLPAQYALQTPAIIKYSLFFETLYGIETKQALLYFIERISAGNVIIKSNNCSYKIDSLTDLLCLCFDKQFYKDALTEEQNAAIEELLKTVSFSKEQLIFLLKRAHSDDIEYYLFHYKCFLEKDLLDIVNDIDIVRKFPLKTLEMLYFYFNPKREWKTSLTPLLDIYYFCYRVGHILGLKNGISFKKNGVVFTIDTESEFAGTSLAHLTEHVALYQEAHPTPLFEEITKVLTFSNNLITPCHSNYNTDAEHCFHKQYTANQMIYFSSGWDGHIIGLAMYGDYLVYSNRGEGGAKDTGCRIFKIKDRKHITPDFIKSLINGEISSQEKFHTLLNKIVDLHSPIVSFECKKQKYDTCSFVNPKSMIEAMIVLLQAGSTAIPQQVKEKFVCEKERKKYKSLTSFIRNSEVDELIKNMFYAKDPYLITFYAELIKQIIYQHNGNDRERDKDIEEYVRACDLYERTPAHIKQVIDSDNEFLDFMADLINNDKENSDVQLAKSSVYSINFNKINYEVTVVNGNITDINNVPMPLMHYSDKQVEKLITCFKF